MISKHRKQEQDQGQTYRTSNSVQRFVLSARPSFNSYSWCVKQHKTSSAFNSHTKMHNFLYALGRCFVSQRFTAKPHWCSWTTCQVHKEIEFWQHAINFVSSVLSHSQHPKNSWRTLARYPASQLSISYLFPHANTRCSGQRYLTH